MNSFVTRQVGVVTKAGVAIFALKPLHFPRMGFDSLDDLRRISAESRITPRIDVVVVAVVVVS